MIKLLDIEQAEQDLANIQEMIKNGQLPSCVSSWICTPEFCEDYATCSDRLEEDTNG